MDRLTLDRQSSMCFSPEAQTALTDACTIAANYVSGCILPEHLLAAVVHNDNSAVGLISTLGGGSESVEVLEQLLAVDRNAGTCVKSVWRKIFAARERMLRYSVGIEAVLAAAERKALELQAQQVTTEHLLYGLTAVESGASEVLQQVGLTAATLDAALSERYRG